MNRTPPKDVRVTLRREVAYGCPVPGCDSPYLELNHFDPPWHVQEHHNPEGMIALCAEHHAKADAGAFTRDQLRELKKSAGARDIGGRFDWMRNDLLMIAGGNFHVATPVIFQLNGKRRIWVNQDENGLLLLNIRFPTLSGEKRIRMEDNFWLDVGEPADLECPPSGRLLKVEYPNGDTLRIEFFELTSLEAFKARYPVAEVPEGTVQFPVTAVETQMVIAGTGINFGPKATVIGGVTIEGGWSIASPASIGVTDPRLD